MCVDEFLENIPKIILIFCVQFVRFIDQVVGMAHDVNHPLVQCLVGVVVRELDALGPTVQPTENGCLLHDACQNEVRHLPQ